MEKVSGYKVTQLKDILKELNLPTTGMKVELIARLTTVDPETLAETLSIFEAGAMTVDVEDEAAARQGDAAITSVGHGIGERTDRLENRNDIDAQNLIQRELDLLRRENALLQRELRWAERSGSGVATNASRTPAPPVVRIRDISDMLADFNGDKDTWKGQAGILRTTYQLTEDAMKMLLSSRLKGKAQEWYHSTATHLQLSVDELFERMDRIFNQRRTRLELRRSFEKRMWQVGESFSTYLHAKVILANKASIVQEELTDYLINGIPDSRMRD
ncbi:hypothetical protein X777_12838 [Ooceraea biroi]|uniref:SAP domain-containing protein n=1 Tax=Ooceraea biroi TaxID=2015173 RepID=A0A026VZC7_OOCBI|nr:hypothetical protein X777_12838 [Ooceraea biroi]